MLLHSKTKPEGNTKEAREKEGKIGCGGGEGEPSSNDETSI